MSLHAVKILGINITISSKKEILEYLQKFLLKNSKSNIQYSKSAGKPLVIVTPNPEQIVYARGDSHFRQIMNQADVALPDGIGIVWASRILSSSRLTINGLRLTKAIPGVELMEDLVAMAAKQGVPTALIGGRGDLAVEAFECLQAKYPGLKGWGHPVPEIQLDQLGKLDEFVQFVSKKIRETGVRIVFVALGAPKQEYFIERLARLSPVIYMSVGGSFDMITSRTPRAPQIIRTIGLEWFWRLLREPWRLGRQLALVKFVWLVLQERYI